MSEILEPCKSCGSKCCIRFAVSLTGFDIRRICDATGLKPDEFAFAQRAKEVRFWMEQPLFLFAEGGGMVEHLLCVKRKEDGSCYFHKGDAGCSIHEHAPLVCRAYPFTNAEGAGLRYVDSFVCHRKWGKGEVDVGRVAAVVEKRHGEIAKNGVLVRKWNAERARGGGFADFLAYLLRGARKEEQKDDLEIRNRAL